jgi:hypothetical protein
MSDPDAGEDVSPVPDEEVAYLFKSEQRYRNALLWIRTVAGLHYFGGAFNPEHMRTLANLAANALDGRDLPDFEERMADARREASEMADALGFELVDDDGDT